MKNLMLLIIAGILGSKSYAQCCPAQCEAPKPKVITKTKVVEKKVPVVVEKEVVKMVDRPVPVRVVHTVYKKVQKKNRISGLAGTGPTEMIVSPSEAILDRDLIFGLQYQRMITEDFSLGVQVQSNETVLGSFGFDF